MKSFRGYVGVALAAVLIDRVTKLLMQVHGPEPVSIVPGFWLELTYNRGVSWGILSGVDALSVLARYGLMSVALGVLVYHAFQRAKAGESLLAEVLIFAGAISNGIDRLLYGVVIDFIAIGYDGWVWPIFNSADSCIVLGVVMLFWSLVRK